ncbi:MAG: DUF342 domain-containing protein [Eubacterium sp.]|nr:DUF342 domain-containing protein [Eubacterium sp.]
MAENAYFELVNDAGTIWLKVHPPGENGEMFGIEDVNIYLDLVNYHEYDIVAVDSYLKGGKFEQPFLLGQGEMIPESERCRVTIIQEGRRALARFYPPMEGGVMLTEEDIVSTLKLAGVRHGVRRKVIQHFLSNHEYCRDYIIAEATPPIQGHDAKIRYFFDINATAKPKLNEDGSVDFHQLGTIKAVKEGDKLAELTPADRGRPGVAVDGKLLSPKKVKNLHLRFGRNIEQSKDRCKIYSKVSGHVTLVEDMVMVSDIYQVPANVDSSTGDIVYKGTVEVTGNVNTGFRIEAEGDIVVNGVVEGATLISGGNIVLKRGMQGMDRGELQAEGNITAKFLENCKVRCKGALKADAVLHSQVECRENIDVLGKKGLINGGQMKTYGSIHATTLGSTMGAATVIEVISDVELIKRINSLKEEIEAVEKEIGKIDQIAELVKAKLEIKEEIPEEQMKFIREATVKKPALAKQVRDLRYERESILERVQKNKNASIRAEGIVYGGVKLMVKDAVRNIRDKEQHSKYVREGADVRSIGL